MNRLFSILIVTLNSGSELRNTVESILSQSYQNYEVIIKDGMSTDSSLEELPRDERIHVSISGDNGIYDAMNQALRIASGEYVHFLNAGDLYADTEVLSKVADCISSQKYHDFYFTNYFNEKLNSFVAQPGYMKKFFLFRKNICHQTMFLKRGLFRRYGYFNTNYIYRADHDYLLNLIKEKCSYKLIDIVSVKYDGSGVSSQQENQDQSLRELTKIRKQYYSKHEYYVFFVMHALTLTKVRSKMDSNNILLRVFYRKFANFINRYV